MTITDEDVKKLKKTFTTKDDLKKLENRIDYKFDDFEIKIEDKLTQFRSDIFDKLDGVLKEILASREEQEINAHRLSDHEDRIEKLEKFQFAN